MARYRTSHGYHQHKTSSGWSYTHRTVAEKKLGGSIFPGYHVHHINGVKTDNRPSNLTVVSASHHAKIHNKK